MLYKDSTLITSDNGTAAVFCALAITAVLGRCSRGGKIWNAAYIGSAGGTYFLDIADGTLRTVLALWPRVMGLCPETVDATDSAREPQGMSSCEIAIRCCGALSGKGSESGSIATEVIFFEFSGRGELGLDLDVGRVST